jgi:hypothetical protein
MTGCIPAFPPPLPNSAKFIPPLFRDKATGRILHFRELLARGVFRFHEAPLWVRPQVFEQGGIEVVQNPPEDIADLCRDMLDACDGVPPTPEAADLQRYVKAVYYAHIPDVGAAPDIGPSFVLKYRHLIEDRPQKEPQKGTS